MKFQCIFDQRDFSSFFCQFRETEKNRSWNWSVFLLLVFLFWGISSGTAQGQGQNPESSQILGPSQNLGPNQNLAPSQDLGQETSSLTLEQRVAELEALLASQKAESEEKKWKDSRKPSAKVSAMLHMDSSVFDQDDASVARVGDVENGTEIRRARLGVSGEWLEQYKYKVEVCFANAGVALKDSYVEMVDLPWISSFKLGYYKECINMEEIISDNHVWLIERSSINNTLSKTVFGRSIGGSIGNANQKLDYSWQVGVFYKTPGELDVEEDEPNDLGVTVRVTQLFYEEEATGTRLHLGLGYSSKFFDDEKAISFTGKAESNDCNALIGPGSILGTKAMHTFVPEFLWTSGSLAIHAEYVISQLENSLYDDPTIHGGFVQVGWMLTGEQYTYLKGRAILGRIEPNAHFAKMCKNGIWMSGPGAWQLVYRFSWSDLSDFPLEGSEYASKVGKLCNHTIGLNWHLNANFRLMFNYILSNDHYTYGTKNSKGDIHVLMTGLQLHF